ncbi:MAG: hypothetical protein JXR73_16415 [Candidatus Omnitrophica bacterium]|nr:hypothetical protein [Candidatus Omnitrophota bacterium]
MKNFAEFNINFHGLFECGDDQTIIQPLPENDLEILPGKNNFCGSENIMHNEPGHIVMRDAALSIDIEDSHLYDQ